MSKDSVKKRLSSEAAEGMSFTEFTYQFKDMTFTFVQKIKIVRCKWAEVISGEI
jgi:hypothetical protein